jgi:signal transduction histidine kinase
MDPDLDKKGLDEVYKNVIKTGIPIQFQELNASAVPFSKHFILKLNAFKVGEGLGMSIEDITLFKNAISELKIIKKKLSAKNSILKQKNKELKKLSSIINYHLKNPINEIDDLVKKIFNEDYLKLKNDHLFEKINFTSNLLNNKINALQEINELKTNKNKNKEKIKFESILNAIIIEMSELLEESETVIKSDFTRLKHIYFNPVELHSILYNLISNSIKYRNPTKNNIIHLKSSILNKKEILQIKDNGIGFDTKMNKNKIFSIFKRMHSHVNGLGVGLYIVKSIIDSYGGHIEVKSEINKGTTFKIFLSENKK